MIIKAKLLSELIEEKIVLPAPNENGWRAVRDLTCNDHSERGGFKFDGIYTVFNCFNCGAKFKFEEGTGRLSKNAREILSAFGISSEDLSSLTSPLFAPPPEKEITLDSLAKLKLTTPEVSFPPRTHPLLSEGHEELQAPLLEYLLSRRIEPLKTRFYYSLEPRFLRRIIIPYWRDTRLIFWQARTIDNVRPRYLNCEVAKDAVIYGYDRLHMHDAAPLFVTEGVFNAIMVDGISIMGAALNAAKIEVLKRTRRRLIFVRDRDSQGDALSRQALANGWEVTTVDPRVNDVNESVQRFGLPYTAYVLIKNARHPQNVLQSSIAVNLWGLEDRMRKM